MNQSSSETPISAEDRQRFSECSRCGSKRLGVRSHSHGWRPRYDQQYYFTHWLVCSDCGSTFMPQSCRKPASEWFARRARRQRFGLVGCLALVVIVGAIIVFLRTQNPQARTSPQAAEREQRAEEHRKKAEDRITMAWVICQDFVKDRLKAPGTAKFPWPSKDYMTYLGDDKYRISAWVDSQNAFGALLRAKFTCEVVYEGDETWRLIKLDLR